MTDMQEMTGDLSNEAPAEPIEQATPEAPASDDREALSKIWDKHQEQGIDDDAPEGQAEAGRDEKGRFKPKADDGAEPEKAEQPEKLTRPDGAPGAFDILPAEVKREWANIPEGARTAFATSYQKMAAQAAEAGRIKQGLGPIQEVYNQIAQTAPEIRNMTPQEAARTMGETLNMRLQIQRAPTPNLLKIAHQFGVINELRAALATGQQGQQQPQGGPNELMQARQEIAQMKRQMQQMANPDIITGTVKQQLEAHERARQESEVGQTVVKWAEGKPYYKALELHLPQFVDEAVAALGNGASYEDVLDAAYSMAVERFSLQPPAPQTAPQDGQRTEAAKRAVSTNVRSRGTRPTPLSERDAMAQAYERAMRT